MKELIEIQRLLKAPKTRRNDYGKYMYRSCEDILEAVKPHLASEKCMLTLTDEVVVVGTRVYVKATARITNSEGKEVCTVAYAREDEKRPGNMDGAQITGSASSYARKYALNGLLCIDDTRDPDATNTHGKGENESPKPTEQVYPIDYEDIEHAIMCCANAKELKLLVTKYPAWLNDPAIMKILTKRKEQVKNGTTQK